MMVSKDYHLQLHHFLGHGSPRTTSLSLGRGEFLFFGPSDGPSDGHGLDDCSLSGVEGGTLGGSSSSEEV